MLKEFIEKEKESLKHFFDHLDLKKMDELIQMLMDCQGKVLVTGVGKSGLVAKKIAVTLTSTGTRAFYLSPINALHGDIGLVGEGDIFILLSKSGDTEELLNLVPYIRNKQATPVAIVCREECRLVKACDFSLELPLDKELCPMNLVPTTSTELQVIFGNLIAVEMMERMKFTIEDYALNHPAGRIGRRITIKVQDLMVKGENIPLCHSDDTLANTLSELTDKQCGCVFIVDEKKRLQGVFTDGDLRRVLQKNGSAALETTMKEIMTKSPRWIAANKLAWEAMQLMEEDQKHPITVLPVLDEDRTVVGLIKMHDLVQAGV